ncbi:cytochrome c biogenesis protein ResB [Corynebacterium sp. CCM 8835]|uniref:Cytochrome c biogenesis protein ResB n=1 Tax=Corynebacterium antarcticum TaxID=2800405 RepID=A0A9Q4GLR5_9CORY|nr:cytochrome c biogenesis protein ResB [Corynebacterium antarcticum]MCK7642428.1 cytochrome c biogenesis protein ResB [Corynebacterium antarcticum]MCK7660887.1 cytochrome c biogenesis protein ResB [Corynebacterium antarcticum]MCL0245634.1 cytochrome c biogenesis protein ResB [Corynebacterium antarcticum]MCX7491909.1 cytochrome c biogenesis protein ResB [Corynebacterium antarcticum]MCX7538043.1 cytochrome c biogenesis protein ResB [Corynebacterium antarcticum]
MLTTLSSYPLKAWRWLTSMRTALALLFLLAFGAIPGALLPQRQLNEQTVTDYIEANGRVAEIYDRLELFDVFSSSWYTAIYVLLFISLIGCILPRSIEHYRSMRSRPVRTPRNLSRLPHHGSGKVEQTPDEIFTEARGLLRGWRVAEYSAEEDRAGARSLSAERGYAREFGNLVFHLGLVGILFTIGFGRLVYYEGQVIVVAGADNSQFCNTAFANYDSYRWGTLVDGTDLSPFCVEVEDFTADYLPNGQAEMFTSNIRWAKGDGIFTDPSEWEPYTLRVNHPLRIEGDRIYLQGHGFAPRITVTWPNGESRTQMVQFRPDDLTSFLSSGAMRFDPPAGMYPDLFERRQNQLGIQGLFAPTAQFTGENGELLSSAYPAMRDPALAIDIYRGDTGLDAGRGQSIFSLDSGQIHSGAMQKIERVNLLRGESVTLDDGTRVTFDGANEFVNLQISHDPTQRWVLVSAIAMLGGLVLSLAVKRRRVWVRVRTDGDGGTVVETAGLSRTDSAGWGEEHGRFHRRLLGLPDDEDGDDG